MPARSWPSSMPAPPSPPWPRPSRSTPTAADGGLLGCSFTQAQVEQALEQQSIPWGSRSARCRTPTAASGTSTRSPASRSSHCPAAQSVVRRELLETTANVDRVSSEIVAFARHSDVSVDPRYGTWKGLTVIPPISPPPSSCCPRSRGKPARPPIRHSASAAPGHGTGGQAGRRRFGRSSSSGG